MDDFHKYIDFSRKQRHDFMNITQVIYGYLQMGKIKEAEEYLEKFCSRNDLISELYQLGDEYFAFCLEEILSSLWLKGFEIDINIEIVSFKKMFFKHNYYNKCCLVNNIFKELELKDAAIIYVYIFQDNMGQSILIGDDEYSIEQLSNINKWEKVHSVINDITIYKFVNNNNTAYRLTFEN